MQQECLDTNSVAAEDPKETSSFIARRRDDSLDNGEFMRQSGQEEESPAGSDSTPHYCHLLHFLFQPLSHRQSSRLTGSLDKAACPASKGHAAPPIQPQ